LQKIFSELKKDPASRLNVNLEKQTITIISIELSEKFEINHYKKTCLLNGYDDIDYLLSISNDIKLFEQAN